MLFAESALPRCTCVVSWIFSVNSLKHLRTRAKFKSCGSTELHHFKIHFVTVRICVVFGEGRETSSSSDTVYAQSLTKSMNSVKGRKLVWQLAHKSWNGENFAKWLLGLVGDDVRMCGTLFDFGFGKQLLKVYSCWGSQTWLLKICCIVRMRIHAISLCIFTNIS